MPFDGGMMFNAIMSRCCSHGTLKRLLVYLFICVIFFAQPAGSDTGHYEIAPKTGIPHPQNSNKVVLKRVIVRINVDMESDTVNARCIFAFENESKKAAAVVMGFPVITLQGSDQYGISGLEDFKVYIGSKNPQLAIYTEPKIDKTTGQRMKDLWFNDNTIINSDTRVRLYRLPEKKDEVRGRIHTVYWTYQFLPEEVQFFIIEYTAKQWSDITYITGTASLWKNKVDSMDVSIKYSQSIPFHFLDVSLPNYNYTGDSLIWHFDNYEPPLKENIRVKIIYDWRKLPIDAMLKESYQARQVNDVTYKLDKQYFRYSPEIKDENDPHNPWGGLKGPDYVANEVAFIRNEIFARHGYIFSTAKYKQHYSKMNWYKENPQYSRNQLNYIEKRNVSYLKCIEDVSKSMDPEFLKYFKKTTGILYYDDSMDGEPDHDDPRDQTYYGYESSYLRQIEGCYSSNLP